MAYTNPPTRHDLGARDFGTGSSVLTYFRGPKGKKGLLWDYGIYNILEAFTATTLHPGMQVGIVSDEDAYGDLYRFTSAAITDGTISMRTLYREDEDGWSTYMLDREIPADTVIMVTLEEGTGGGDAGQATPFVDIVWED